MQPSNAQRSKITIYRKPNSLDLKASRKRYSFSRAVPRAWDEQRNLIQVANQVWRHGGFNNDAFQEA